MQHPSYTLWYTWCYWNGLKSLGGRGGLSARDCRAERQAVASGKPSCASQLGARVSRSISPPLAGSLDWAEGTTTVTNNVVPEDPLGSLIPDLFGVLSVWFAVSMLLVWIGCVLD